MRAITEEDLEILKSAAKKWLDTTLSTAEHTRLSGVLARLDGNPLPTLIEPPHRESIWAMYTGITPYWNSK